MDIALTTILSGLSAGLNAFGKLKMKRKIGKYLKENYGCEVIMGGRKSHMDPATYNYSAFKSEAKKLKKEILNKNKCSPKTYELCGDFSLFIFALAKGVFLYPGEGFDYSEMKKSTTWDNLVHMGQGRGSDYTLDLIKREINGWDFY